MLQTPYSKTLQTTIHQLLNRSAHTTTQLRQNVIAYAQKVMEGQGNEPDLPAELEPYLQKVALHAYRVTDNDVQQLTQDAQYSEDEIYELTITAAVGASLVQLEAGLTALKGETPCD